MELVPLDTKWAGSETKLDLKGIYRRPTETGQAGVTLTGPLPLRRHLDWTRKGFEFVSLATLEDVSLVSGNLRADGVDLEAIRKSYSPKAPHQFLTDQFIKADRVKTDAFRAELQAKVDRFGSEAVTEMMQLQDPGFVMPEGIVGTPKATKK